jgi:hypothetical protein
MQETTTFRKLNLLLKRCVLLYLKFRTMGKSRNLTVLSVIHPHHNPSVSIIRCSIAILAYNSLWSLALLERPRVVRPFNSSPAFHKTRRFNTEFTTALHLFLSLARQLQSTSPHPTSPRSILILSTHKYFGLSRRLFHSVFPTSNPYRFSSPPLEIYVPLISSSLPWLIYL